MPVSRRARPAARQSNRQNGSVERTSYTRLFAVCSSAFLVVIGLVGFLEDPSFTEPELFTSLPGDYAVNGWANSLHVLAGLLGLAMASRLSRAWAVITLLLFGGLGLWGVLAPDGTLLAGILPATRSVNAVNLLLALLALLALVAAAWPAIRKRTEGLIAPRERSRREERARRARSRARRRAPGQSGRQRPSGGSPADG